MIIFGFLAVLMALFLFLLIYSIAKINDVNGRCDDLEEQEAYMTYIKKEKRKKGREEKTI